MNSKDDFGGGFEDFHREAAAPPSKKVTIQAILADLRAGLRTKQLMDKYGLTLPQFEELLKQLVMKGLFTKEEFKAWKSHRPVPASPPVPPSSPRPSIPPVPDAETETVRDHVTTYVIDNPEKNNSWALQLFAIKRESIKGAKFKVNMHGRKYAFVVEDLLFRGQVNMRAGAAPRSAQEAKDRREEAIQFISTHGWAAYLERRAFSANFEENQGPATKARLVLLQCRNDTYLAAIHTPAPAVNLYVGSSLESILSRLGKNVDTSQLNF